MHLPSQTAPQRRVVSVPGARNVPALVLGEGPVVLLLHGSADSEGAWRSAMGHMGNAHQFIAPSLVGARGEAPDGLSALELDLPWLGALVGGLAPVAVVAHSYGGLLALQSGVAGTLTCPLALIEPIAFGLVYEQHSGRGLKRLNTQFFDALAVGEPERALRGLVQYWNGEGSWDALPPAAARRLLARMSHTVAEVLSGREDRTRRGALAALNSASMVLAGERTTTESLAVCGELASGLGVSVEVVQGAGHQAPRTHGHLVGAAVREWLAR